MTMQCPASVLDGLEDRGRSPSPNAGQPRARCRAPHSPWRASSSLQTVTVSPSSGLFDGQEITVDATGLEPATDYKVLRCDYRTTIPSGLVGDDLCDSRLEEAPVVRSSVNGTLSTTVEATQRFERADGGMQLCRANCVVVVTTSPDGPELPSPAGFAMATGALSASPSTGLADGQAVTVSGTDLMPTYDGPAWWIFQTGEWTMGQCGAGILSDVSVAGVFRHCTVPPGGGAVAVTGSSVARTMEVQATLQPPIGGPVDCTTGEACLVILTRIEEDGQVTLLHAPLTFA
jgi:Neocarzinostatin family